MLWDPNAGEMEPACRAAAVAAGKNFLLVYFFVGGVAETDGGRAR